MQPKNNFNTTRGPCEQRRTLYPELTTKNTAECVAQCWQQRGQDVAFSPALPSPATCSYNTYDSLFGTTQEAPLGLGLAHSRNAIQAGSTRPALSTCINTKHMNLKHHTLRAILLYLHQLGKENVVQYWQASYVYWRSRRVPIPDWTAGTQLIQKYVIHRFGKVLAESPCERLDSLPARCCSQVILGGRAAVSSSLLSGGTSNHRMQYLSPIIRIRLPGGDPSICAGRIPQCLYRELAS